ncbi:hypothetical protein EWH73_00195 [Enterococcus faecium]|nr:hypothetical protein CRN06_11995 [Enterococcus faecium]PHK54329.1 hypothetical protein CR199_13210 [Enterococcus faecium]QBF48639.1 hypothetical protein EXV96_03035 [Enterococcus faecium]QCR66219.1 hypothetical protein FBF65_03640 [Enterococcus faecium]QEW99281.1 hypothetical protein F6439_12340 [Enterococcus faecium]
MTTPPKISIPQKRGVVNKFYKDVDTPFLSRYYVYVDELVIIFCLINRLITKYFYFEQKIRR